jgi:hypothetical protein
MPSIGIFSNWLAVMVQHLSAVCTPHMLLLTIDARCSHVKFIPYHLKYHNGICGDNGMIHLEVQEIAAS